MSHVSPLCRRHSSHRTAPDANQRKGVILKLQGKSQIVCAIGPIRLSVFISRFISRGVLPTAAVRWSINDACRYDAAGRSAAAAAAGEIETEAWFCDVTQLFRRIASANNQQEC